MVSLRIERCTSADLTRAEIRSLRAMFDEAWGCDGDGFDDDDWDHASGGIHVLARLGNEIVGHGAVIERHLEMGDTPLRTGYVEAIAVRPTYQGRGFGSAVMRDVGDILRSEYELGALSTGSPDFYERLGWQRWLGPTWVRKPRGLERTQDDDGGILVLRTPSSPPLDLSAPLSCEWRSGDVW